MYWYLFIFKEKIFDIKWVVFGDFGFVFGIIIMLKYVEFLCNYELINWCIKWIVNNYYLWIVVVIILFILGLFCRKNDLFWFYF